MKAQHPDCKILLFSGHAHTQDVLEDAHSQGLNSNCLEAYPPIRNAIEGGW
jgi:hypothetical protein